MSKRDKRNGKTNGRGHLSVIPTDLMARAQARAKLRSTCVCVIMPGIPAGVSAPTYRTIDGMRRVFAAAGQEKDFNVVAVQGMSYEHALAEVTGIAMYGVGAEDYLYIDTDIAFDPRWVTKFATMPQDILVGTYRQRTDPDNWCVNNVDHDGVVQKTVVSPDPVNGVQLAQINDTGFGAVRLRRHVLERMAERYPDLEYVSGKKLPGTIFALWDPFIFEHGGVRRRTAGDTCFFKRARDSGFEVWALADMPIDHAGMGSCSLLRWLKEQAELSNDGKRCKSCGKTGRIWFEHGDDGPYCGPCLEGERSSVPGMT